MQKLLTGLTAVAVLVLAPVASFASSVTSSYGSYSSSNVSFAGMQEQDFPSNAGQLYQSPQHALNGLAFGSSSSTSSSFVAASGSGANGHLSNVKGVFSTDVNALPGSSINSIHFSNFGDYTLVGSLNVGQLPEEGGPMASVISHAEVSVTGINGHHVATSPATTYTVPLAITSPAEPGAGGSYTVPFGLPGVFGPGAVWFGNGSLNLGNKHLGGAITSVHLSFTTALSTYSLPTNSSLIRQDQANIAVTPNLVPTPAAVWGGLVLLLGLGGFEWRRRRVAGC